MRSVSTRFSDNPLMMTGFAAEVVFLSPGRRSLPRCANGDAGLAMPAVPFRGDP